MLQSHEIDELLVVDDGSTDDTVSIIKSVWKSRSRIILGPEMGLGAALSLGVREAENEFIARSDQDDVSSPRRIEKQLKHLLSNPNHVAVGSAAKIYRKGRLSGIWVPPTCPKQVSRALTIMNPLIHSSVMFRRDSVVEAGNYRTFFGGAYPEDFDLWIRLNRMGEISNLRSPLVTYLIHERSMSRVLSHEIAEASVKLAIEETHRVLLGRPLSAHTEMVISWINGFSNFSSDISLQDLRQVTRMVGSAPIYGEAKNYFPSGLLRRLQIRLIRQKFNDVATCNK
jgi:glycosyltransferase involved in cell wall biosynthesis